MITGAAIGFGLRGRAAFGTYDAAEDGLGEGFVSGVWEDRNGLCMMFPRGFSVFIAYFQQHKPPICSARIIEIIWQIHACAFIVIKTMSVMAISITRYASRNSPKA